MKKCFSLMLAMLLLLSLCACEELSSAAQSTVQAITQTENTASAAQEQDAEEEPSASSEQSTAGEQENASDAQVAPEEEAPADDQNTTAEQSAEATQNTESEQAAYDSYQAILDDYTARLQNAVPGLIDEYNAEAAENDAGLNGLATICNAKVSKLAAISVEGMGEMARYYYRHGSGAYEEYSEWTGKLQDVYMTEAAKIQAVYMDSAT